MAVDSAGNLYIADTMNNRIRRVDNSGDIATVAGNGVADYAGDGNYALQASFDTPWGVAVGGPFTLYIADSANMRIRRLY
ncbi:MAG: hypothetical protein HY692_06490 [Cyanobacteria bacterium NC_groundwater_1444_Ag_S-0.65um_54_12]|nr:hypothetical protein [Cyanobacteria bacterium NC_groundwater_1444_Ag_S-0.65um_54_12]